MSIQSFLQARLIREAARPAGVLSQGERVALHGRVLVHTALSGDARTCLWYRRVRQGRIGDVQQERWVTSDKEELMAEFSVETLFGAVRILGRPSEIQSLRYRTEYGENERAQIRWLDIPERATVVGRLEGGLDGWRLVADGKAGLLLSPHPPVRAATREILKGVGGLLLVTAGIVGGLLAFYGRTTP